MLITTLRMMLNHPLNRDRKWSALRRYVSWQVGSRLLPGKTAVPFVDGSRLFLARGMHGATGNVYNGLAEFPEMAFALHLLRPGEGFMDVGANVGAYTVLASAAAGARSLAFEPVPQTFAHLQENIRVNDIASLAQAFPVAIGREPGSLKFTTGTGPTDHVADRGESEAAGVKTIEVSVKPLDDFAGMVDPVLIKIDVEGFETEAIAGGQRVLNAPSLLAVIMELNGNGARYGYDEDALHRRMLEAGFRPCTYAPLQRRLEPLEPLEPAAPERPRVRPNNADNMVYVKDLAEASRRVASARRFSVHGTTL